METGVFSNYNLFPLNSHQAFPFLDTTQWACVLCLVMIVFTGSVVLVALFFGLWKPKEDDLFATFCKQQRQHLSDLRGPFLASLWDDADDNNRVYSDLLFHTEEVRQGSEPWRVTHFQFLVHGHRGTSRDLAYVQAAMRRTASVHNTTTRRTGGQRLVLHSITCNEKRTDDGVIAGGERVVEEMLSLIRERMNSGQAKNNDKGMKDVTISLLGNSLGGLYARYALATLRRKCQESCEQPDDPSVLYLDGKYALHFNVFCTTATPHLGVASHTFLPLPRPAEVGVAHAMGQSGKDLFRLNTLLKDMATEERFLAPLAAFSKRTAYANAYSTDFPVPACTAAFLHADNTYPHSFVETREQSLVGDESSSDEEEEEKHTPPCSLVIATVRTPRRQDSSTAALSLQRAASLGRNYSELAHMSASLDALGWEKVFVDMRKEVPRIVVPKSILRRPSTTNSNNSDSEDTASTGSEHSFEPIHMLKGQNKGVSSRELVVAVTEPGEMGVYWPLGHNMIVAFSRSRWSTYRNRAGRPVVDALAREIVNDILSWNGEY